jgi:hypothetical protein
MPTRCLRCKELYHVARECKRPRSPPSHGNGDGPRRAPPAERACSARSASADTSSASRASTPPLPPPRSLLVAPSPPRTQLPEDVRLPELCVIERTPVIDAEAQRLHRAVLVSVVGERASHLVIAALIAEVLQIPMPLRLRTAS